MKTFAISEFKKQAFEDKMNRFSNKADKLNIPFGYTLESASEDYYKLDNNERVYFQVFHYSVFGESPVINGYTFLAKIEPMDGYNLVHSHNNDYDFSEYRTASLTCEHCHINRIRNFYYLIQNTEDNTVKMVGHNCLANYISLDNAESIAQFYSEFFISAESFENEDSEYSESNRSVYTIKVIDFLAYANLIVKKSGYVSTKNEDLHNPSTKNLTVNEFFYTGNDKIKITEEDKTESAQIIDYVKNTLTSKSKLSEYEFTILKLIESGNMKVNHAGYIVSIIPLYNKMITDNQNTSDDNKIKSSFIGSIGDKITNVNAVVVFYNQYETQYGYTHLYKFNSNGNIIAYFSSKSFDIELNQNVMILSATIKAHDIYNGDNQTVITRAKIQAV